MVLPTPAAPQNLALQDPLKTLTPEERKRLQASVREFEPPTSTGAVSIGGDSFWYIQNPQDILPSWGLRASDRSLREFSYAEHNWLGIGAIINLIKRYVGTPWEIKGEADDTEHFTDVLQNAEFSEGYSTFMTKVLWDYFTQDFGAVIEVIGGGEPDQPLKGRVLGLAHLDSLRCVATGNLEFPIVYWSSNTSTMHKMHRTRVIRVADMASPVERAYSNGYCALRRMISLVNAQILLGKHQNESLSDMPPTGFLTLSNVKPGDWEAVMYQYEAGRKRDGEQVYRPIVRMESMNPAEKVTAEFIRFSMLPEGFSYREYIEIHVNAVALALGEDPQEIWPLSGSNLGTGAQSEVLHAKGKGKAFGNLMRTFERIWNIAVLPDSLEFEHKYQDPLSDQEEAATAKMWIEAAYAVSDASSEQKLQLIANKVPAFADVLLDEAGQLRLPDVDKKPVGVMGNDVIAEDGVSLSDQPTTPAPEQASDTRTVETLGDNAPPQETSNVQAGAAFKDIKAQLDAGLITVTQAQQMVGQIPDKELDGLYVINGMPVPREKVRELWQAHFGRGIASFDTVVSGTALEATTGAVIPGSDVVSTEAQPQGGFPADSQPTPASSVPLLGQRRTADEGTANKALPGQPGMALGMDQPGDAGTVASLGNGNTDRRRVDVGRYTRKDIQATRLDFENDFADAVTAAQDDDMNRRRFGIVARALINRYGQQAYSDGLEEGGVEDGLSDDDRSNVNRLVAEQSSYVSDFADRLFDGSEADPDARASAWYQKSIYPFYLAGLQSSDTDGLYEWVYGDTEHCEDCIRLNGQKHRMSEWMDSGWLPKSDELACHGFNCACDLVKTRGRARGGF